MKVFLAFVCLVAVASAGSVPFKTCGSNPLMTLSSLDITPLPLQKGKNSTITASGSLSTTVSGGTYALKVTYMGIQVYSKNGQLCSSSMFHCPMKAGPQHFGGDLTIPSSAPSGSYDVQISATSTSGANVVCITSTISITSPSAAEEHQPAVTQEMVDAINADPSSTWTAEMPRRFERYTMADARRLTGTRLSKKVAAPVGVVNAGSLPTNFSTMTQWPGLVTPIRNQERCGSCWAFAASEVLADRARIATRSTSIPVLSPQQLVSCDTQCYGCQGGFLNRAWDYMEQTGIVANTCYPYTSGGGNTGQCDAPNCPGGGQWNPYKATAGSGQSLGNEQLIQQSLMQYGPVQTAFTVYQDFMSYKGGVYQHRTGSEVGGHSVRIVGWGVTSEGVKYWNVANSWGTSWGNSGYFMILRGVNECNFESQAYSGTYTA